jgi:hypothetical protein
MHCSPIYRMKSFQMSVNDHGQYYTKSAENRFVTNPGHIQMLVVLRCISESCDNMKSSPLMVPSELAKYL